MLEIRLSGEQFTATELPPTDTQDDIHVILSTNGTSKINPTLWTSIFTDKRLRYLSLIDLQLYESDANILAGHFCQQNSLNQLTLNSVRQSVYSFDTITNEGLQKNKSITHLTLTNLRDIDAATISSLIRHNHVIQYLSLTHDNISPDGGALIASALKTNPTLISLDLSHNNLTEKEINEFNNILRKPHASLTSINLDHNIIEENPTEIDVLVDKKDIETPTSLPTTTTTKVEEAKYPILPVILVTFLFFLWGVPNQLNGVLIRQFSKAFVLSSFEAGLVQSAFYMGYFIFALPAAYVLRRWGYKTGILLGLILFGTGSFLFWPAALIGQYLPFLISLFIIATGLAFLETAANPFIAHAAGPASSSAKRLNIAQAFNPLGSIAGALFGTLFIFSGIELDDKEVAKMKADGIYDNYLKEERLRVVRPYMVLAALAFLWALLIAFVPFPANTKSKKNEETQQNNRKDTLCQPMFVFAVVAVFAYVGAQVGTWSYFIQYSQDYVQVSERTGGYLLTGTLVMFALGRFSAALMMHYGFSPSILLTVFALVNIVLILIGIFVPTAVGLGALFFTSFFMSLMFPTIFALGIKGMSGHTTKLASCILIMAIIGGAICTPLMGLIAVTTNRLAMGFTIIAGTYVVVAVYAFLSYVLTKKESTAES